MKLDFVLPCDEGRFAKGGSDLIRRKYSYFYAAILGTRGAIVPLPYRLFLTQSDRVNAVDRNVSLGC